MATTAVTEGEEALEEYEIVLETAQGEELEVTMAPDDAVLEEGEGTEWQRGLLSRDSAQLEERLADGTSREREAHK